MTFRGKTLSAKANGRNVRGVCCATFYEYKGNQPKFHLEPHKRYMYEKTYYLRILYYHHVCFEGINEIKKSFFHENLRYNILKMLKLTNATFDVGQVILNFDGIMGKFLILLWTTFRTFCVM